MNALDEARMKQLLKQAVPPAVADAEPARDLWPQVLQRLDSETEAAAHSRWVWVDVALLGGLAVMGASFPATIPLLLYYL
jgi:hypothetical protein